MKILNVDFDFIAIIDCLSDDERKEFCDSASLAQYLASEGLNNRYYYCGNKASVMHLLELLASESTKGLKFPIVFISHGTNLSLLIKHKSENIEWQEMREPLMKINLNMHGNLLVLMSCCYGFEGYKIDKRDSEEESFFGIIGPQRIIKPEESINANEIFFNSLLKGMEVPKAVEEINKVLGPNSYRAIASQDYKLK